MALFATIDGARVAFTGDAFFPHAANPDSKARAAQRDLSKSRRKRQPSQIHPETSIDHEPEHHRTGSWEALPGQPRRHVGNEERFKRQEQLFHEVIADPDVNFGLDPSWCSIYPYQMQIKPGDAVRAEIRVKNYRKAPIKMEIALIAPGE